MGFMGGIILGAGLILGGCTDAIPDYNESQQELVEQYAAEVLLQYDTLHKSRLVSLPEETQETEETVPQLSLPSEESIPSEESSSGEETRESQTQETEAASSIQTMTMEAFLGLPEGVTVIFSGLRTADYYPDDQGGEAYFGVDALVGEQLVVLKFIISNQSGMDQTLDILSTAPGFMVTFNGSAAARVMTTLLSDDLSTYVGTIPTGQGVETVLLAQIPQELVPEQLTLEGTNGATSAIILNNVDLQ